MEKVVRTKAKRVASKDNKEQNLHGQRLVDSTNTLLGSEPNEHIWILECSNCDHEYRIKSSNWDQIRCPKCGGV